MLGENGIRVTYTFRYKLDEGPDRDLHRERQSS
jgi:hypothetical protein